MTWGRRLFVVVLWLGFVFLWLRVYGMTTVRDVTNAMTYLISITSVYGVLVTVWVLHNLALFRRKGPRKGVRILNYVPTHDELRSYVVIKTNLKETQAITVSVAEGRKLFRDSAAETEELVTA